MKRPPRLASAVARVAFLAAALSMPAVAPAWAQLSSNGGPISYSADNLEYTDDARQLVLIGNVDVVQSDARLQSNKLTLWFSGAAPGAPKSQTAPLGSGDIERILAVGDVHYVRPQQTARGDQAVYDVKSDTVTFTGNVVVASPDNVVRGATLVLEISTGRTTLKPGAATGGRVQGVFKPNQKPGAAPTAPPAPETPPARRAP